MRRMAKALLRIRQRINFWHFLCYRMFNEVLTLYNRIRHAIVGFAWASRRIDVGL